MVFGEVPQSDRELATQTRSMLQIITDLSFKRGMLLTLFAVVALLLAQTTYALIKRKLSE